MGRVLILAVLVAGAAALRIDALTMDLPYTPDVDEPAFVETAARMAATGLWSPYWFGHPGSTTIYPLAIGFQVDAAMHGGRWLAANASIEPRFAAMPSRFYLAGRLLSILYGSIGLVFVFFFGRRVFDADTALMGVALLAASPPLVHWTRLARTDGASFCFGALALWTLARTLDEPSRRNHVLAGVALGLAVATKYDLAVFGVMLLPIAFRGSLKNATLAIACAAATFFLTTPGFLMNVSLALKSIADEVHVSTATPTSSSALRGMWWYMSTGLLRMLGIVQVILLVAGALAALATRRWQPLVMLLTLVAFIGSIGVVGVTLERWLIPVLPICAMLIAYSIANAARVGAAVDSRVNRRALAYTIAIALTALSVRSTLADNRQLREPTSTRLAREWLIRALPSGTRMIAEYDGGNWVPLTLRQWANPLMVQLGDKTFVVRKEISVAEDAPPLDQLRCEGYTHLLINQSLANHRLRDGSAIVIAFQHTLADHAVLQTAIDGWGTRNGPAIRIYDISSLPCVTRAAPEPSVRTRGTP